MIILMEPIFSSITGMVAGLSTLLGWWTWVGNEVVVMVGDGGFIAVRARESINAMMALQELGKGSWGGGGQQQGQ